MSETPKEAARRFAVGVLAQGFEPDGLFCYTNQTGAPLYYKARAKNYVTEEKWIRPFHLNGSGYKLGLPDLGGRPKPLYRLHELADADPSTPVWFVEGEQKADKLAALGFLATTVGGANDDETRDFGPLRGRQLIVWPDNDPPGQAHGQRVADKVRALGGTVERIDVGALGLPEGADVIDHLKIHPDATAADLMALPRTPDDKSPTFSGSGARVELLRADNVTLEPVRWLWKDWIAAGKLHVLAGPPGTGKTTIALSLAAAISCAGRWPDGTSAMTGDVIIWSGEDDPADTLAPRLKAAGADLSRIHFVRQVINGSEQRPFDPARDMASLIETAKGLPNLRLLILDPIVNAVAGDSNKNAEVRRDLAPVVELAASLQLAALGISHFTKGSQQRDPVERVTGSLAFGALARVVLAAVKVKAEDGSDQRLLARAKSNLGPDDGGFAYSLEQVEIDGGIATSRVLWGAAVEGSARELLADAEAEAEAGSEHRDAADWLREVLSDLIETDPTTLRRLADEAGHAWRTVQRASKKVGVIIARQGFGKDCRSIWRLPLAPTSPLAPLAPDLKVGATGATDRPASQVEVF